MGYRDQMEAEEALVRERDELRNRVPSLEADCKRVTAERDAARKTVRRLNRRCQAAEAAAADAKRCVDKLANGAPWVGGNFGRMLLAWHNSRLADGVSVLAETLKFYAGLDAADLDWVKAVRLDERGQMARDALFYVENTMELRPPELEAAGAGHDAAGGTAEKISDLRSQIANLRSPPPPPPPAPEPDSVWKTG